MATEAAPPSRARIAGGVIGALGVLLLVALASQGPLGVTAHDTRECAIQIGAGDVCRELHFDAAYYLYGLDYSYCGQVVYERGDTINMDGDYRVFYPDAVPHDHPSRWALAATGAAVFLGAATFAAGCIPWSGALSMRRTGAILLAAGGILAWPSMQWHASSWGGTLRADLAVAPLFLAGLIAVTMATHQYLRTVGLSGLPSIVK